MTEVTSRLQAALAGRYAIQQEVGRGGMASVYLAEDRKHRRRVAVKVLRPDIAATVGKDRFLREIGIAARLTHPHIMPVYDSGEAEGLLYYVMPHVEGESLRDRLEREGSLPVDDATQIAREVASALAYAHRHHVVHRDIKPANILLSGGHAVVTDFGVARALGGFGAESITAPGLAVGTPTYMSPEQASGEQILDGRTDVYALGCVMFEMLVGEPPYTGPTTRAVIAKCFAEPVPSARKRRNSVPTHIDTALLRALAKSPDERFDTTEVFAQALVAPAIAAGGGAPPTSIAVLPFVNMSSDAENDYLSDGISEEIINALAKLRGIRVAARTSSFAYKGASPSASKVGAELGVETILEGSVRRSGNRLRVTAQLINTSDGMHLWSERYDREMEDVFAIQDDIAAAIVTTLKGHLGVEQPAPTVRRYTEDIEAYELYLRGRYVEQSRRRAGLDRGIEFFEQAIGLDPDYALAYAGVADSYTLQAWYRFLPPQEAFPKSRVAAMKALEVDEMLPEAHTSLGAVQFYYDWDWHGAERSFTHALQLNPRDPVALHWYAEYLAARYRLDEALEAITEAHRIDPLSLTVNAGLGWIYYFSRSYDLAIEQFEKTLELDPDYVFINWFLGQAYLKSDRMDDAVAALRRGRTVSGGHPGMTAYLGYVCGRAGEDEEAHELLQSLYERSRETYVPADYLAVVNLGLERMDRAFTWLEKGAEERAFHMVFLGIDPLFDDVRGDDRFTEVLGKIGLDRG
jgi:serine/threonine-protein kinase